MNAFNKVNLAAACILASTQYARELGIPESRWVCPWEPLLFSFPHGSLTCDHGSWGKTCDSANFSQCDDFFMSNTDSEMYIDISAGRCGDSRCRLLYDSGQVLCWWSPSVSHALARVGPISLASTIKKPWLRSLWSTANSELDFKIPLLHMSYVEELRYENWNDRK